MPIRTSSAISNVKMNARFLILILLYFVDSHDCGLTNNPRLTRIINGADTSIKYAPYMLSLMLNDKHVCGAVIVTNNCAVTAAHCCAAAENQKSISLRSGSSILGKGGIIHRVINCTIHEKYDPLSHDYDIAVIKVTPSFIYNNHTKAVDLAPDKPAEPVFTEWGDSCGWGYYMKMWDFVQPSLSKYLKCTLVPLVEKSLCRKEYSTYIVTSQMTCYGFKEGVKDACQGDSGGPIVNKDNILLGITSWGDECAKAHSPGVYTDAIELRHWIKSKIRSLCKNCA